MSTPPSAQSPPQSKPRKKRSADIVSFEDLLAAHKTERGPGQLPAEGVVLIGVDLELQRRMAERLPLPASQRHEADVMRPSEPDFTAPTFKDAPNNDNNTGAPISGALNIGAPKNRAMDPCTPPAYIDTGPDKLDAHTSHFGAPEFDLRDLLIRRSGTKTYTVHSVSRIEDVFTSAERDLLRWLWEKGRRVPVAPRIRIVTGPNGEGARRLATQAGLIYNTFKNLTRALSTKFAVDIVKPERNLPTIYAVYHYSAILERQRHAGFGGAVHKNGGGRELVNAEAQPATRRPDLAIEDLEQIIGARKFGPQNSGTHAPNFAAVSGKFGAPNFAAPIRNKEYTSGKELTSSSPTMPNASAPTIVVDSLFERTGRTDIDASRIITKGCLEANPTIQPEEIARLIRTTQIPPTITNPVGLLIRALPSRCAPESIANYRERWRQEDEHEKRRSAQQRAQSIETARSILDSVSKGEESDTATIEWAKSLLAETSDGKATTS